MTIVSVTPMWSRDTLRASISDDRKTKTVGYQDAYQVLHSADATREEILSSSLLPKPGQFYNGSWSVFVRDTGTQKVSPILTIVTVNYSGDQGPNGEHPADIPDPEIEWNDVEKDEPIDTDADGKSICTVNGEPIYGVTELFADQVINVKRAFRFINPYAIRRYRRSVNSDNFAGWPPGTARLRKYTARNVGGGAQGYWMVNATIQFREPVHTTADKTWYKRVRHEGLYEKVDGQILRAVDRNGQAVTKPVMLKADGTREFDIESAHWLTFRTLESLPYTALGLL